MRWKLILITSIATSLISLGLQILIMYLILGCPLYLVCGNMSGQISKYDLPALLILILPAVAAFFVYRHTARRRKLQGLLTFIFSVFTTLAFYLVYLIFILRTI